MDNLDVFLESVKNLKTVGTVAFSSKFLVKKMVAPINYRNARCIVELGTGNACITKGLLQKMNPQTQLFSFEINAKFYEMVKGQLNDRRLHLINDSAENLGTYIRQAGFEKADCIVSSLPLVSLPKEIEYNIVKAIIENLTPEGMFIQYSYSTVQLKKFETLFGEHNVKLKFAALNFPPAFVYICRNTEQLSGIL